VATDVADGRRFHGGLIQTINTHICENLRHLWTVLSTLHIERGLRPETSSCTLNGAYRIESTYRDHSLSVAAKRSRPAKRRDDSIGQPANPAAPPRIIGGKLRGRKLSYAVDSRTRPMKERVREAVFNLLGPGVAGKHAIDLFAGTGALGFEAISRSAASATFVERHFPTANVIKRNAEALGVLDQCSILPANTLLWSKRLPELPSIPWVVFCSPPYELYVSQTAEMLALIEQLLRHAPAESMFAVEADERFDFALLPDADRWDVRAYPPAVVGVLRMGSA
jgi:16S rRNA (guanine966-N2)-methyltransferase